MNVISCYGCPLRVPHYRKRCQILEDRLKLVRPAKLTAIAFDCPTKRDLFTPGQPVEFRAYAANASSEEGPHLMWFPGWVWKWDDRKVVVVSRETRSPIIKRYPNQLKATNGGWKRCCIYCGKPEGVADKLRSRLDPELHDYVCRFEVEPRGGVYSEIVDYPCEYREATA